MQVDHGLWEQALQGAHTLEVACGQAGSSPEAQNEVNVLKERCLIEERNA